MMRWVAALVVLLAIGCGRAPELSAELKAALAEADVSAKIKDGASFHNALGKVSRALRADAASGQRTLESKLAVSALAREVMVYAEANRTQTEAALAGWPDLKTRIETIIAIP